MFLRSPVSWDKRFCLKIIPQSTKCKNSLGMKGKNLQAGRAWHDLCVISCACSVVSDCNPMDCSPPGSFDHGIYQARILEWVAISSSRGSWHDLWSGQKQRNYLDSSVNQKTTTLVSLAVFQPSEFTEAGCLWRGFNTRSTQTCMFPDKWGGGVATFPATP